MKTPRTIYLDWSKFHDTLLKNMSNAGIVSFMDEFSLETGTTYSKCLNSRRLVTDHSKLSILFLKYGEFIMNVKYE